MEMKNETSTIVQPTKGLPPKHFAILFEGAWLFIPDPKDATRILAICPLIDEKGYCHECNFGRWGGVEIVSLDNMDYVMPKQSHYRVDVDRNFNESTYGTFGDLFSHAAHKYHFVYLPQRQPDPPTNLSAMRSVSIPIPTSLRADGALATAEIGGLGMEEVFESSLNVKRPFVTFLFIYEYSGRYASATVHAQEHEAVIEADDDNPMPHLIFNVHPMKMTGMDTCGEIVHSVATFETLRQSVSKNLKGITSAEGQSSFCNVGLFPGRGKQEFLCGDSGLTRKELGIDPPGVVPAKDTDLASCAGGGMAVG
jgi:hypothetical protein